VGEKKSQPQSRRNGWHKEENLMVRRGLGRGLDALIGGGEEPSGQPPAQSLLMMRTDRIAASHLQPRLHFDPQQLEELVKSIKTQGIIEPLIVRTTSERQNGEPIYELIAGERRLRAARMAAMPAVPVVVRELDDRSALEMSLVENLVREGLGPIEEARALRRLAVEFGLSHDQLAERIGKSRPFVSNAIRLLELPEPLIEMLQWGELTVGQARPLLALATVEERIAAAGKIVRERLSARGAEGIARQARPGRAPARQTAATVREAAAGRDPNLVAMEESMRRALRRQVRIIPGGAGRGKIEMEYYNDDDLTVLCKAFGAVALSVSP
jgi:ParB family chromosome partitioning protein